MKRRKFLASMRCAVLWPLAAQSQTPPKVARIGWLTAQRAPHLHPMWRRFAPASPILATSLTS